MASLPDELAHDFPSGDGLRAIMRVREAFREAAIDAGFDVTGCGVGCGGENSDGMADIGLRVNGRNVEVRIDLRKQTQ